MEREFQVVDLIDSENGRYVGQALFCPNKEDCPVALVGSRYNTGIALDSFVEGAKQVGGQVNLYHINMPIEISTQMPYNEIRNTVVGEMKMRTVRNQQEYQNQG